MQVLNYIFVLLITAAPSNQIKAATSQNINSPSPFSSNYYEAGLQKLNKGDWKEALNVWLKAKTTLQGKASDSDPRIGFAFTELVTDKNAKQYYEVANTMYFWGIQGKKIEQYKNTFKEELIRLQPIIDDSLFSLLEESLNNNDATFLTLLREFWIKQDPFPASAYNERLIEHWSRIAYAREHYTYSDDTAYGTDERGLIYVRFGKPAKIKKRNISINSVTDPVTGARIDLFNNISFEVEVWYYFFEGKNSPSTFTFGHPGTGGSYGLQPGILSMIPIAGNRISSYFNEQEAAINVSQQSGNGGVLQGAEQQDILSLPGHTPVSRDGAELMIKYAVLEDIGAMDPFYNELYIQMTRDIIRAELSGSGEKFTKSAQINLTKYDHKERSAYLLGNTALPSESSSTKSKVENLSFEGKFYRFLDENLDPLYMLVTEAIDFTPIILHLQSDNENAIYQLNTLYEYDKEWLQINKQPHILPLNQQGHFGKGIYYFDRHSAGGHILIDAQFVDKKPGGNSTKLHEDFNAEIIASTNQKELTFPEKLELNPQLDIQLSDVILGDAQVEEPQNRIPFTPNITSIFEADQEVIVYFEVYNLPSGKDYQVEYFFEKPNEKGKKIKDKGSIILNFVSSSKIDKKWFSANMSDLQKGNEYNLVVKLSVPYNPQTITRRVTFSTTK